MSELRAVDRCDRCGAQARVVTSHQKGNLYWCSHHYNKYEYDLMTKVIHDERMSLITQ